MRTYPVTLVFLNQENAKPELLNALHSCVGEFLLSEHEGVSLAVLHVESDSSPNAVAAVKAVVGVESIEPSDIYAGELMSLEALRQRYNMSQDLFDSRVELPGFPKPVIRPQDIFDAADVRAFLLKASIDNLTEVVDLDSLKGAMQYFLDATAAKQDDN